MSYYRDRIQQCGSPFDPKIVESFMRVHNGTLDHLTRSEFVREVKMADACIKELGIERATEMAKTIGC